MLKQFLKRMAAAVMAVAMVMSLPIGAYAKPKNLSKNVKVGDTVYFGKYEQDGNTKNGKEKIEWEVLDKQGNKALLISKKILDVQRYNEKGWKPSTWEKCTLRKWLNKDFLKAGFSAKEQKKIKNTKVVNKDNKERGGTKGGKDTTDKIFCLSIDEARKYFKDREAGKAEVTNYSIKQYVKLRKSRGIEEVTEFRENEVWGYWLCSPGYRQTFAATVGDDGEDHNGGLVLHSEYGCRPALWVKL